MIEAEPALLRPDALHGLSLDPAAPIEGKTLELLRGLRPGLTEILLHAARSGDEIRAITSDAPARIEALRLMTESTTIRDCLTSEGISLVGYRELRDAQRAGA